MRSVAEHRLAVLARIVPLPPVSLPLAEAAGLVAAETLTALVDLPGFDNSAMDGYAVRAADLQGASPERPVRPRAVGHCPAGDSAGNMGLSLIHH